MSRPYPTSQGPFRADQIREGDPYELSRGHAIRCLPTGGRGSDATATGAAVLKSDPQVESAGVDTGFSPAPDTLWAPDVAVGNVPTEPGWVKGVPPLAVEYADTGQDEADLAIKIRELLQAGTLFIWVVRLNGPRRVEIHQKDHEMRIAQAGEQLVAPGVLKNPVPVEALYDWQAGREVVLRNLLQRYGYDSLDAIRAEGETQGRAEGKAQGRAEGEVQGRAEGKAQGELTALRDAVLAVFAARGLEVDNTVRKALASCQDPAVLRRWHGQAVTARRADDALS